MAYDNCGKSSVRGLVGRWPFRAALVLVVAVLGSWEAPIFAAGAEYAFRWEPAATASADPAAVMPIVGFVGEKAKTKSFRVRYFDVNNLDALPTDIRMSARQREELDTQGRVIETTTSYKLRAAKAVDEWASAKAMKCPLLGAGWETELDVNWPLPRELENAPASTPLPAALEPRVVFSKACEVDAQIEQALPAQHRSNTVAGDCISEMTRHKEKGDTGLKIERWVIKKVTLLEVSQKVPDDNEAARKEFYRRVVQPLLDREVRPTLLAKQELGRCAQ